ncbi:hypothetical protein GUITHDRAFT_121137 [Guillardia theta CCMP2712]|uniref:Uncharacterized protein n=1 Tax=Guillardia theta (strain CCMP2712) TaxID=905079 RepID=L1I9B6_GUITC|nr:hypothetical protein GUITHDRAFT_121137 [Guillardia theta CCMP2712]EKX32697.1 hypothetical protein GUITHDRAFT_121137 [Guillardia theta CCMP2712]|eukprot:XP_005819677.1 hypothetical protein GUITHDRAFT_121137 [Guillardia theta CCMP2712]
MKILLLLLLSCFPALSDHLLVRDEASSAVPPNLHALFAQPSLRNIASSKSAQWSQLKPRQLAAADKEIACPMRVRGGMSLRRGQVINFMTGEPVEEVEFEDIDSEEDMRGAVPVDWLPRGSFLLPEERRMLNDYDAEDEATSPPPVPAEDQNSTSGSLTMKMLRKVVEWGRNFQSSSTSPAEARQLLPRLLQGLRLSSLGCFGGAAEKQTSRRAEDGADGRTKLGEQESEEEEPRKEIWDGDNIAVLNDPLDLRGVRRDLLSKKEILNVTERVEEMIADYYGEYFPEFEAFLGQCHRMRKVLMAVGDEEPTEVSRNILESLHKAITAAEQNLKLMLMPFGRDEAEEKHRLLCSCVPIRPKAMERLTEITSEISALLEEGADLLLVDFAPVGFSQLVKHRQARASWRRECGAHSVAGHKRKVRKAVRDALLHERNKSSELLPPAVAVEEVDIPCYVLDSIVEVKLLV